MPEARRRSRVPRSTSPAGAMTGAEVEVVLRFWRVVLVMAALPSRAASFGGDRRIVFGPPSRAPEPGVLSRRADPAGRRVIPRTSLIGGVVRARGGTEQRS